MVTCSFACKSHHYKCVLVDFSEQCILNDIWLYTVVHITLYSAATLETGNPFGNLRIRHWRFARNSPTGTGSGTSLRLNGAGWETFENSALMSAAIQQIMTGDSIRSQQQTNYQKSWYTYTKNWKLLYTYDCKFLDGQWWNTNYKLLSDNCCSYNYNQLKMILLQ